MQSARQYGQIPRPQQPTYDTVLVVVVDEASGRFVLEMDCYQRNPTWCFLGDRVYPGTSPKEVARRVVHRKLGIEGMRVRFVGKFSGRYGEVLVHVGLTSFRNLVEQNSPRRHVRSFSHEEVKMLPLGFMHARALALVEAYARN